MSVSLRKKPAIYMIYTEDHVRVGKAIGFERTWDMATRIESMGKHVKPLFFNDLVDAIEYTEDRDRHDSIKSARHMAMVVDKTNCLHMGLFYDSTLEVTDTQWCASCGNDVPQYEL